MDQFRPREDRDQINLPQGFEEAWQYFNNFLRGRGIWIAVLVLIILYVLSGLYKVGPGEKGVVLLFGKVNSITEPGLRYRLPRPFMSHEVVDTSTVRQETIGYRQRDERTRIPVPSESLMLTGDENIVEVQLFVQYVVQDPVKFLFGAHQPEMALRASAEIALRGVVGENTIDQAMVGEGRNEIQKKVETYLQKLMNNYDTGLLITQARLLEVDPPGQVKEAFHDVVRAREDRIRLMNEAQGYIKDVVPKARVQAQQKIREAEAYKVQRVIRAQGDAQRFSALLQEYSKAPGVTKERLYLESVERFLPGSKKIIMERGESRVLPLLPLTGIEQSAGPSGAAPVQKSSPPEKKGN